MVCYEGYWQGDYRLSFITLMSGGLDSCLMAVLTKEAGREQKPLFINYGQLNVEREFTSVMNNCRQFSLPEPAIMDLSNFGKVISSGLTDSSLDIVKDAFLPGRNFLFLLTASAFAVQNNCTVISIGLLSEETAIFPDQTDDFLITAENSISKALDETILRGIQFRGKNIVIIDRENWFAYLEKIGKKLKGRMIVFGDIAGGSIQYKIKILGENYIFAKDEMARESLSVAEIKKISGTHTDTKDVLIFSKALYGIALYEKKNFEPAKLIFSDIYLKI